MARKLGRLSQPRIVVEVDAAGALPTSFPVFQPGENKTQYGSYFLDPEDLANVLAEYEREGVDLMVDLEHDSIDEEKRAARSDAADALAWFKIAPTPEGGLVAQVSSWCPEGARRLTERTQRYISPVFEYDEGGHIKRLINVALCARPATLNAAPLVAARKVEGCRMDPELLQKILDALSANDAKGALELLKAVVTAEATEGAPPSDAGANALAENAAPPAPPPAGAAADPAAKEDKQMADALRQVTCRKSSGEAIAALRDMYETVQSLKADRQRAEMSSRLELVGDLVRLGAETPATAWDGEPEKQKLVARLAAEPVESMRARVAKLAENRPEENSAAKRPTVALSATDQRIANGIKDPAHRERFIQRRLGRS